MTGIIVVNQSSSILTVDIVNSFTTKYDSVIFVVGNSDVINESITPNIIIKKIISYNRSSLFTRVLTWVISAIEIYWILKKYPEYEVFYITNPPISYFFALHLKQPFSVLIYDIYPDALKSISITEDNFLYKFWSKMNKKIFLQAKCIFTLSDGMKDCLSQYIDASKIKVVPIWSHLDQFKPILKSNNLFVRKHNLEGKFVIMYSGNIGYTHNVSIILEMAKRLILQSDIIFLNFSLKIKQ